MDRVIAATAPVSRRTFLKSLVAAVAGTSVAVASAGVVTKQRNRDEGPQLTPGQG